MNKNFMDSKLIDEICKDKAFFESLLTLENNDDIRKAFLDKGLEMSDEDVEFFKNAVVKTLGNDNQVPDEILDNISGGKDSWIANNWQKIVYSACAVTATGLAGWGIYTIAKKTGSAADKVGTAADGLTGPMNKVGAAADGLAGAAADFSETARNANAAVESASQSWVGKKIFGLK